MEISKSVRLTGTHCMGPVQANREIVDVPVGGHLEIITNDPCAKEDLAIWARFRGHTIVLMEELEGGWLRIVVRREK